MQLRPRDRQNSSPWILRSSSTSGTSFHFWSLAQRYRQVARYLSPQAPLDALVGSQEGSRWVDFLLYCPWLPTPDAGRDDELTAAGYRVLRKEEPTPSSLTGTSPPDLPSQNGVRRHLVGRT